MSTGCLFLSLFGSASTLCSRAKQGELRLSSSVKGWFHCKYCNHIHIYSRLVTVQHISTDNGLSCFQSGESVREWRSQRRLEDNRRENLVISVQTRSRKDQRDAKLGQSPFGCRALNLEPKRSATYVEMISRVLRTLSESPTSVVAIISLNCFCCASVVFWGVEDPRL